MRAAAFGFLIMTEAAIQSIRVTDRLDPAFSPAELGTPPSAAPLQSTLTAPQIGALENALGTP